jgi:Tfp pilus assembly protein PilN
MPTDINLLQNQLKDTTYVSVQRTKIVVWIGLVLLILLIGACVGLYLLKGQIDEKTSGLTESNSKLQLEVSSEQKGIGEAQAYQAQLSNISLLLKQHVFVSPLVDELAKYTYERAAYTSIDVTQGTGKIHIEGLVENYDGLGKLLLGLSTSPNFSNVKLLSILPSSAEKTGYLFSIDLYASSKMFSK